VRSDPKARLDHSEPGTKQGTIGPIEGRWPNLLAVRDLASGCQLAWLPVPDETAETTIQALQWLFLEHGALLVLKCDNGSGFIAEAMRGFLARWQLVRKLPSRRTQSRRSALVRAPAKQSPFDENSISQAMPC
jgi:hypothetical protein